MTSAKLRFTTAIQTRTLQTHTAMPQNAPDYRPATGLRWCRTNQRYIGKGKEQGLPRPYPSTAPGSQHPAAWGPPNPQLRPSRPARGLLRPPELRPCSARAAPCPARPAHQAAAAFVRHILRARRCRGGEEGGKAAQSSSAAPGAPEPRPRAGGTAAAGLPGRAASGSRSVLRGPAGNSAPPKGSGRGGAVLTAAAAARRSWPLQTPLTARPCSARPRHAAAGSVLVTRWRPSPSWRGSNSCDAGEGHGAVGSTASGPEKQEVCQWASARCWFASRMQVEEEPRGISRAVPLPTDGQLQLGHFMQCLVCAKPLCTDLRRWSLVVPVLVMTSQSLPQVAQHEVRLPCTARLPAPFTFFSVLSPGIVLHPDRCRT